MATELVGETIIVRLKIGSLTGHLSDGDERLLTDLVRSHAQIVLDLSEIGAIGGVGLHLISDWIRRAQSVSHTLVLAQCSRPVMSLLGLLRIPRSVPVFSSLREALDWFQKRQTLLAHVA